MLEKNPTIRNPLSIIAVFAGLSEISGTLILPHIDPVNQTLFIYFLIGFPCFLVSLFFITLWTQHTVLYAPSDYRDENNFFKQIRFATSSEINEKIEKEITEQIGIDDNQVGVSTSVKANKSQKPNAVEHPKTLAEMAGISTAKYRIAEELVVQKIQKEFKVSISKGIRLHDNGIIYDGLFEIGRTLFLLEVKYFRIEPSFLTVSRRLEVIVRQFLSSTQSAGLHERKGVVVILALVFEATVKDAEIPPLREEIKKYFSSFPISLDIRLYKLDSQAKSVHEI